MVRLILTRIEVRRLTVQVGTLISQVAGIPVQTPAEFAAVVEGKLAGVELTLQDGKRVTVKP